eukprot:TRINITY_DN8911_c0_g1_i9.p2 TRINITY_DN8911_c0_g1~~TRINITY_DN8911_c0_g1_i9.p2  ORF type:complete len:277 (-),score=23.69 TRINITY_DN8911_c0_g1_i9:12-842(-)
MNSLPLASIQRAGSLLVNKSILTVRSVCNKQNSNSNKISLRCFAVSGTQQFGETDIGGVGGSSFPPSNANNKITGEGDDKEQQQVEAILIKEGIEFQSLPLELQQALKLGIVGIKDVQQWLAVAGTPIIGWICKNWPGFRERVLGNPRFLLALMLEEAIGCSAKYSAEVRTRGDNFNNELYFVASDMVLEVIVDFFLVWLLSPRRSWKAPPTTGIYATIAKLPSHAFQRGGFSISQRVGSYFFRSFQFLAVGFGVTVDSFYRRAAKLWGNNIGDLN